MWLLDRRFLKEKINLSMFHSLGVPPVKEVPRHHNLTSGKQFSFFYSFFFFWKEFCFPFQYLHFIIVVAVAVAVVRVVTLTVFSYLSFKSRGHDVRQAKKIKLINIILVENVVLRWYCFITFLNSVHYVINQVACN